MSDTVTNIYARLIFPLALLSGLQAFSWIFDIGQHRNKIIIGFRHFQIVVPGLPLPVQGRMSSDLGLRVFYLLLGALTGRLTPLFALLKKTNH